MKKVVMSVYIVIVVIFSIATSFLGAAKKGSAFDLSDLKQALPDGHLQKIKEAAR